MHHIVSRREEKKWLPAGQVSGELEVSFVCF